MASISRTTAVLFLAAASVYPGHVNRASGQTKAKASPLVDVRLLEDSTDPFAVSPAAMASSPLAGATSQPSAEVRASATGTSINLQDTNIIAALNMLAAQNGRNIVAGRDVKGTVTLSLNDVTLDEALDAICKQNDLAKVDDGPVIYVYSRKEYTEQQKASRRTATQVFTLHYVPVADAEKMVKNLLSAEGKTVITAPSKTGVGFDNASAGGNDSANSSILVVTDYEENLNNVAKLVQEIDVRPVQVLVEATILRASLQEDNALGVDFTVLGGVDFSSIGTNNGQFLNANTANPVAAGGDRLSSVGTGNNFTNGINGVKVGFVSSNVSVFLSALEQTTDTAVLANPKVLVLNKQKGEVKVVRKDPYRGAIVTDVNGQSRQEVQEQETGTKLVFRPFVGNDGFIRLEVHPEDSTALENSADSDLPPSSLSTEATTNVMVKDGRTIVIGGLFRESTTTSRSQIPILGSLPIAGNLFRKKVDNTIREEIIILLTPHIVKDDEAYARMSAKEAIDVDRIRVGIRKGLMPWGRERLAESAYENAVKEMAKPTPNKRRALWHLDIALNLNPKFLEAIDLKEKVSGKVVTSVDHSSIRSFVRDAILDDTSGSVALVKPAHRIGGDAVTGPLRLVSPADPNAGEVVVAIDATTQPTTAPAPQTAEVVEPAITEPTAPETTVVEVPMSSAVPIDPTPSFDTLPPATVTVTEMVGETETTATIDNPALVNMQLPRVLTADEIAATMTTQPSTFNGPAFEVTELPTMDVDGGQR